VQEFVFGYVHRIIANVGGPLLFWPLGFSGVTGGLISAVLRKMNIKHPKTVSNPPCEMLNLLLILRTPSCVIVTKVKRKPSEVMP
jgi:hypothetical protein